jgi:RimJ/RimL family protein N-acetyltransferase
MALDIPRLPTERLVLRAHGASDLADIAAMWADAAVTRFIGGQPLGREDVWMRVLRHAGHWALCGYGFWVVEEAATGRLVGEVGLADFQRAIEPPLDGSPECGWVLASWAHGVGYATEAVTAALAWADRERAFGATAAIIAPGNAASIRVAEKVGYRQVDTIEYKGEPTLLFRRPRG